MSAPLTLYRQYNPWTFLGLSFGLSWGFWGLSLWLTQYAQTLLFLGYLSPTPVAFGLSRLVSRYLTQDILAALTRLPPVSLAYVYLLSAPFVATLLVVVLASWQAVRVGELALGVLGLPLWGLWASASTGWIGFEIGFRALLLPGLDARIQTQVVVDLLMSGLWFLYLTPYIFFPNVQIPMNTPLRAGFYALMLFCLTRIVHGLHRHFRRSVLVGILASGSVFYLLELLPKVVEFANVGSVYLAGIISLIVSVFVLFELLEHHAQHRLFQG